MPYVRTTMIKSDAPFKDGLKQFKAGNGGGARIRGRDPKKNIKITASPLSAKPGQLPLVPP